jgi:hypothetical protein
VSFAFLIAIEAQVASNWAFTCQFATRYTTCCVATTTFIAFLVLFSSLSLCFVLLCSFAIACQLFFVARPPNIQ